MLSLRILLFLVVCGQLNKISNITCKSGLFLNVNSYSKNHLIASFFSGRLDFFRATCKELTEHEAAVVENLSSETSLSVK